MANYSYTPQAAGVAVCWLTFTNGSITEPPHVVDAEHTWASLWNIAGTTPDISIYWFWAEYDETVQSFNLSFEDADDNPITPVREGIFCIDGSTLSEPALLGNGFEPTSPITAAADPIAASSLMVAHGYTENGPDIDLLSTVIADNDYRRKFSRNAQDFVFFMQGGIESWEWSWDSGSDLLWAAWEFVPATP